MNSLKMKELIQRQETVHIAVQEALKQLFEKGYTPEELGPEMLAGGARILTLSGRVGELIDIAEMMASPEWYGAGTQREH